MVKFEKKTKTPQKKRFPDSQSWELEEGIVCVSRFWDVSVSGIQVGEQVVAKEKGRWVNPWGI